MEERRFNPAFFALLSLPCTAMGFALCVQISALSWLLHTQFHMTDEQVGKVWAAGPLAGILGQLAIGFASDKVWFWGGRRRPFIVIGGLLATLMLVAMPNLGRISDTTHLSVFWVAVVVALLYDLSFNVSFNPARSIIADVTPEGKIRTQGFAWMQTVSGFFGVLAYLIGAWFGNYVLIYTGMFVVFVFAVFPPFLIREPRDLQPVAKDNVELAPRESQTFELLKIYGAHAFTWLGVQTMFVYVFTFIKGRVDPTLVPNDDAVGQVIALSFLVMNLVGFILPAAVLAPLCRKLGRVRTHVLCLATMTLGYAYIATWVQTPIMLYAMMFVVGIGWAAVVSLPFAIFSEKVDPAKMGMAMGVFNLSVVLPQLIVSGSFGRIIDQAESKSVVFWIAAGSLAVSTLLWLLVRESPDNGGEIALGGGGGH